MKYGDRVWISDISKEDAIREKNEWFYEQGSYVCYGEEPHPGWSEIFEYAIPIK